LQSARTSAHIPLFVCLLDLGVPLLCRVYGSKDRDS
jgi:hypothetical protein